MAIPLAASMNMMKILQHREMGSPSCTQGKIYANFMESTENLYKKDLLAHYGCVNALEFCNSGDDKRVLLWDLSKAMFYENEKDYSPIKMERCHNSNIFCVAGNSCNTRVLSGGNDRAIILHDIQTRSMVEVYLLDSAVNSVAFNPSSPFEFISCTEGGAANVYDTRTSQDVVIVAVSPMTSYHSAVYNPMDARVILTANSSKGVSLWDVRKPHSPAHKYIVGPGGSVMHAKFDRNGGRVLALTRRNPPILFNFYDSYPSVKFVAEDYINACTMKNVTFAGYNDEYVLSGSDNFNIYAWKVPRAGVSDNNEGTEMSDKLHVLEGHRSVVNQVCFDPVNGIIASSGVEKLIKIWSPLFFPHSDNEVKLPRQKFTNEDYSNFSMPEMMSHDYSEESTAEDSVMMAFFDTLVARDRRGQPYDMESDDLFDTSSDSDVIHSDFDSGATATVHRGAMQVDAPSPSSSTISFPSPPHYSHDFGTYVDYILSDSENEYMEGISPENNAAMEDPRDKAENNKNDGKSGEGNDLANPSSSPSSSSHGSNAASSSSSSSSSDLTGKRSHNEKNGEFECDTKKRVWYDSDDSESDEEATFTKVTKNNNRKYRKRGSP